MERRNRLARGNSLQERTIVLERPTLRTEADKKEPSLFKSGRHQITESGRPNGRDTEWRAQGKPSTSKMDLDVCFRGREGRL